MKKLILIDGHALIFRTYYAFLRRPMINSKGEDTSILFGFTKTLFEIIQKERPSHIAVAFDPPAKTFRHEMFPDYKANRSETPELIKSALKPLIEIVEALQIPVIMKEGFEADDVIGTVAKEASKKGFEVLMVTPDKDYGQLIETNIIQYKPAKSGSEAELIDRDRICSQYSINSPEQVIDILTIWGDASDNIPGVRGIGEVGAKKLIAKYGSVENLYQNLDELSQKQKEALIEAQDYIYKSKELVTIKTDVPIEWDEESIQLKSSDFEKIKDLFSRYEFDSLSKSLSSLEVQFGITPGQSKKGGQDKRDENTISKPVKASDLSLLKEDIQKTKIAAIHHYNDNLIVCSKKYIKEIETKDLPEIREIMEDADIIKCGYDLKYCIKILINNDIQTQGYLGDIELMHYLIMPERAHKVEILARAYLNTTLSTESAIVQPSLFDEVNDNNSSKIDEVINEVSLYIPLFYAVKAHLQESSLTSLYENMEMPLIKVLAQMELNGIKIDTSLLENYSNQLKAELEIIENDIREIAQEPELNISSPKQLSSLLYDKLNVLDRPSKGNKQPSTDEETLLTVIDKHPIISKILEFRNIKKLVSTYIDPLPQIADAKDGKIHTTYNQALTATGRLSSIKPNLQNIPIRTERGREIRKAFIPSNPDGYILSADYSQIELRLMAHMSNDPNLIDAFVRNQDIHTATAAKIFKIGEEEVSKEQRGRAKTANFGIIYGISAFGLSQRLNISRSDSKKLIEDYFESYPDVKRYMTDMTEKATQDGYVQTIYGRKRYLPDIKSKNPVVRGLAERNAINAPIQGSAADIIKMAMINVEEKMRDAKLKSKMVLQVHDELVFDVIPGEENILSQIVKEGMESVIKLSVPMTVECQIGKNWLEAH